jgi:hypothetical protein
MNEQNKSLILGLWFLCAVACYLVGLAGGAIALVAIGAVLELTFWVVGLRAPKKQGKLLSTQFRCFNCKATIAEDDDKCPNCGWTWETFTKTE